MEEKSILDIDYFLNTDNKDLYLSDTAKTVSVQNNAPNVFHSKFTECIPSIVSTVLFRALPSVYSDLLSYIS